jgi:hypothetical protein
MIGLIWAIAIFMNAVPLQLQGIGHLARRNLYHPLYPCQQAWPGRLQQLSVNLSADTGRSRRNPFYGLRAKEVLVHQSAPQKIRNTAGLPVERFSNRV